MSPRTNRCRILAMAGLAIGLLPASDLVCAQIPCEYEVTIIASANDCGGFGTVNTVGLGLNKHGDVVGYYKCPLWENFQGFVWTAEAGFEPLDPPQGVVEVFPTDINNNGIICGTLRVSGVGYLGFVYDKGEWTILPPVVDQPGAWSSAAAINNAGLVVGQRSITENLNPQNAYIWSADEGFTDLGVMIGPNSAATDINESDDVCGWTGNTFFAPDARAFLYTAKDVIILEPVPGGFQSAAFASNNQSNLVGTGWVTMKGFPIGAPRAFLWDAGKFTMLGTLPDHMLSRSDDINDSRVVVGGSSYVDGNPNIHHAFVFDEGVMINLNDLIDPGLALVLRSAASIGNTGQIVANGNDPKPNAVSFLLTPQPGPVGDLNGDCRIGAIDLLMLLAAWGDRDSPADLNEDGTVDQLDLRILLGNWSY